MHISEEGLQIEKITPVYDSAAPRHPMADQVRALFQYRALLVELVLRNIKARYKRSVLGVAWTMLNPLLTMLVLNVVFSQLFAFSVPRYAVYLLCGLLLWNFFSQSTVAAMRDLVWSGALLKRMFIPQSLFVLAAVGTGVVNLLLALGPLGIVAFLNDTHLNSALLFLPVAITLAGMFAIGVGLGLSTLAVFFADVVDMYQIALLAWMYLTPIFYPLEILAPRFLWIIRLNPLYYLVECFRAPIYLEALPGPHIMLGALASALGALLLGGWLFARSSDKFSYYL